MSRLVAFLFAVCLIVAIVGAIPYSEDLEDDVEGESGLSRKRTVQWLGSGLKFELGVAFLHGRKGYACRCTRNGYRVSVETCQRARSSRINCIA